LTIWHNALLYNFSISEKGEIMSSQITNALAPAAISDAMAPYMNPAIINRAKPEDPAPTDNAAVKLNLSPEARAVLASKNGDSVPVQPAEEQSESGQTHDQDTNSQADQKQ